MTASIMLPPHAAAGARRSSVDPGAIRAYAADLLAGVRPGRRPRQLRRRRRPDRRLDRVGRHGVPRRDPADRPPGRRDVARAAQRRPPGRRRTPTTHAVAPGRAAPTLVDEREQLVRDHRAACATGWPDGDRGGGAAAIQAELRRLRRPGARPTRPTSTRWVTDLMAEEEAMREAFDRVLTLEQVEQRYGGVADPADAALDSMPGSGASPEEVNDWWDGLTRDAAARDHRRLARLDRQPRRHPAVGPRRRQHRRPRPRPRRLGPPRGPGRCSPPTRSSGWTTPGPPRTPSTPSRTASTRSPASPIATQLYIYDPTAFDGDGAVAVSAGDLDTADNVAVTVPGLRHRRRERAVPGRAGAHHLRVDPLPRRRPDQRDRCSGSGTTPPTTCPGRATAGTARRGRREDLATAGGDRLADTLDGLRASRDGEPGAPDRDRPQLRLDHHRPRRARPRHPGRRPGLRRQPRRRRRHRQRRPTPASTPTTSGPAPTAATRSPTSATTAGVHLRDARRRRARRRPGRGRLRRATGSRPSPPPGRRRIARRVRRPLEVLRPRHRVALQHQPDRQRQLRRGAARRPRSTTRGTQARRTRSATATRPPGRPGACARDGAYSRCCSPCCRCSRSGLRCRRRGGRRGHGRGEGAARAAARRRPRRRRTSCWSPPSRASAAPSTTARAAGTAASRRSTTSTRTSATSPRPASTSSASSGAQAPYVEDLRPASRRPGSRSTTSSRSANGFVSIRVDPWRCVRGVRAHRGAGRSSASTSPGRASTYPRTTATTGCAARSPTPEIR